MINLLNEYELAMGTLPSEPESNQVIFIENHKNPVLEAYITANLKQLKKTFDGFGLEFIYLPDIVDGMSEENLREQVSYLLPWLKPTELDSLRDACKIAISELYSKVNLKDGVPVMVNGSGRAFKVEVKEPWLYNALFYQIAEAYGRSRVPRGYTMFRESPSSPMPGVASDLYDYDQTEECHKLKEPERDLLEDEFAEADRLYRELKKIKPGWVVKALLAEQLRQSEKISRIVIRSPRYLLLPDYNDMQIRLTPAAMAFYLLYLRHPEGIEFKRLIDFRSELARLYEGFTAKSSDKETIAATIDTMVNPIDGSADVQRSRIKLAINRAFETQLYEKYAQHYYLDGKRAEKMKIDISPEKVIWEVDL